MLIWLSLAIPMFRLKVGLLSETPVGPGILASSHNRCSSDGLIKELGDVDTARSDSSMCPAAADLHQAAQISRNQLVGLRFDKIIHLLISHST